MERDTIHLDNLVASSTPTAAGLLDDALSRDRAHAADRVQPFPTGFTPLDHVLGGGFRAQELALVGGRPGVGKTIATLQWARHFALQGLRSIFVCYEHSPQILLGRLIALEMGALVRSDELVELDELRRLARDVALGSGHMEDLLREPLGEEAVGRVRAYGSRLNLVAGSGKDTDIAAIEALTVEGRAGPTAVFVDYLQKVPVPGAADDEARTARVVESLKDMAMALEVLVVAVVASDKEGISSRRLRLDHLRGSAALAHECDVAVMLNDKFGAVSKRHLAFDPVRAETFRRKVAFSIDKHRGGPTGMDMEFTKDFASYRFDPDGGFIAETLVDDLLVSD